MCADVLMCYMSHKTCMLVFVIVCVFLCMETDEHKICILFVFEGVLMFFVLSVMVFNCDMFVCFC